MCSNLNHMHDSSLASNRLIRFLGPNQRNKGRAASAHNLTSLHRPRCLIFPTHNLTTFTNTSFSTRMHFGATVKDGEEVLRAIWGQKRAARTLRPLVAHVPTSDPDVR